MSRPTIRACLLGVAFLLVAGAFFLMGLHKGEWQELATSSSELDGTQAMLAYNRIDDERRLQFLLEKGCVAAAQKQIDIDQNNDTDLLVGFFKEKNLPNWTKRYIGDRDPKLLASLSTFKSKYGMRWEQPDCRNTTSWHPESN